MRYFVLMFLCLIAVIAYVQRLGVQTAYEPIQREFAIDTEQFGVLSTALLIGAGGAWLSAELSKLPKVVQVITTDFSPMLLKEQAPKVFLLRKAHTAKITRMPASSRGNRPTRPPGSSRPRRSSPKC